MAEITKLHSKCPVPVPLAKMRVSENAQRELRPARVNFLVSQFDLEQFGYPVVNLRDDTYNIIDGQHRVEALKAWLGDGWEKQNIDCRVYTGLTEKQEADMFDRLNNQLTVGTFDKFKVRVTAGRTTEVTVKKVVERQGLKVSFDKKEGSVSAVGTLVRVFNRTDADTLGRVLRIAHKSFGDPGLTAAIIDGVGHLCQRYNGALDEGDVIHKLFSTRGGVGAVMSRAELTRKQTGAPLGRCVASAIVDTVNAKRGKKLDPYWVETEER